MHKLRDVIYDSIKYLFLIAFIVSTRFLYNSYTHWSLTLTRTWSMFTLAVLMFIEIHLIYFTLSLFL